MGGLVLMTACGDGASAPVAEVAVPASGRYVAPQFALTDLRREVDVVYSVRPNPLRRQYTSERTRTAEIGAPTLTLRMDVAAPPTATVATPQPLLVFIHGGGFVGGDKQELAEMALTYARAGYVVASINYRLTASNQSSDTLRTTAISHATEDAQNAIRFLKVNAARYGLDPTRVVTIGGSAGGAVSLVNAVNADAIPGASSDYAGVSSRVNGAISTGATLIDATAPNTLLAFDAADSPALLFHTTGVDPATGATWAGNVLPTQQAFARVGVPCTVVAQPDGTHTVDLSLGGAWWAPIAPFLWKTLRLAELRPDLR
jgi:acetyl esterase/lipase